MLREDLKKIREEMEQLAEMLKRRLEKVFIVWRLRNSRRKEEEVDSEVAWLILEKKVIQSCEVEKIIQRFGSLTSHQYQAITNIMSIV